jgi:hypothetical protein
MPAPAWLGATSGQPGQAGQVNQFLAAHAVTYLYTGATVAAQTTLGSGSVTTNGLWLAQSFTTSASTATGQVVPYLAVTGTPAPATISLYTNSGGAPSTLLAATAFPKEFATGTPAAIRIPLPSAVTASTTYWIVAQADGDVSDYFSWSKSNQVTGAATSPDGVTWTAQAYGFYFQVLDQSPVMPLSATWEDSGARWTSYTWAAGQLTGVEEYTAGQTPAGYTAGKRTLTYSGGLLAKVA